MTRVARLLTLVDRRGHGGDGPRGGRTRRRHGRSRRGSLGALVDDLRRQGFEVEAAELQSLPHDVELSDRVLARIGM
jgi:hypothetical protein